MGTLNLAEKRDERFCFVFVLPHGGRRRVVFSRVTLCSRGGYLGTVEGDIEGGSVEWD